MKIFLLTLFLLFSSVALAGTQELPEPSLSQITGISTLGSETPNDITTTRGRQAITGWSADGTQLYGVTSGSWSYGYRGSRTASWCGTFTWTITFDQNGNLNPIAPATFTPGNCSGVGGTFYNALNYGATVVVKQDIFSPTYYLDVATLLAP